MCNDITCLTFTNVPQLSLLPTTPNKTTKSTLVDCFVGTCWNVEYGVQQYGHGVGYNLRVIMQLRHWESSTDDTNEIEQLIMVTELQ